MSSTTVRQARWALPLLLVGAVTAGAQLTSAAAASAPDLPALSAQQLLVRASGSHVEAFTGEVTVRTALGLPSLPQQGSVDWSALVSGTHTLRVARDGDAHQRVDLVGDLSQASIVHDGSALWTWSSATRKVTRTTVPAGGDHARTSEHPAAAQVPLTPDEAARQALGAITPTTRVSVGRTARVAGRPTYVLQLAPRDGRSLVGSVRIYLDARTSMVLRTTVAARSGADPAVDVAFTDLRLAVPPSGTFAFAPSPSAVVRDVPWPLSDETRPTTPSTDGGMGPARTYGSGWATVVESRALPVLDRAGSSSGSPGQDGQSSPAAALLRAATPVRGSFGAGRLLSTRLVSVLLTDDGRVFTGAVTSAELLRVANATTAR